MAPDRPARVIENVAQNELQKVAETLLRLAGDRRVWLFYGDMGAGKTTVVKALCQALKVKDLVTSPTFSIVNEYVTEDSKIFHFDFYRIKSEAEAYDIGTEEYFYSGAYCFVEWPERIPSLIPASFARVHIRTVDNDHRTIDISVHDGEEENRF